MQNWMKMRLSILKTVTVIFRWEINRFHYVCPKSAIPINPTTVIHSSRHVYRSDAAGRRLLIDERGTGSSRSSS